MYCPSCGHASGPDARFCTECGAALLISASVQDAAPIAGSRRISRSGYQNPSAVANAAAVMLQIYIAYCVLFMLAAGVGIYDPDYYVEDYFIAMNWARVIGLPLMALTWIFWLTWVYRINANAVAQGARPTLAPMVAIIVQIIPVLNLVTPLIVLRQTWKVAADPAGWRIQPASPVITIWWLLGLVTVGGRVLAYLIAPPEVPVRLNMMYEALVQRGLLIDIMRTATDVIGAATALILIASITRMQMSSSR